MLSYDLNAIETHAIPVDGRLEAGDETWQEGDNRPADAVRVTGRLSSVGAGRYYFSGQLAGEVVAECRRCLTEVTVPVTSEASFLFAEAGTEEADEPDVFPIDPKRAEVDLRPAVREEWLLAAPAYALCREDCKGLCPTCGIDRNTGSCDCAPTRDSRWDALREPRPEQ